MKQVEKGKIVNGISEQINNLKKDITHTEFVSGIKSNTIGYKVLFEEEVELLTAGEKFVFRMFALMYQLAPLVIVPIWAFVENNWWLLTGIGLSYLFSYFAAFHKNKAAGKWLAKIIWIYTAIIICYCLWKGFNIHNSITFFYFCAQWGNVMFLISETIQSDYLADLLLKDSDLFNKLMAKGKIEITMDKPSDTANDETQSSNKSNSA